MIDRSDLLVPEAMTQNRYVSSLFNDLLYCEHKEDANTT